MKISLVAAVAANGVIGADGGVPWHFPEDLTHFRETTIGHPVVMGRRTFETIVDAVGGPLPDRDNVVLTTRPECLPDGVTAVESVPAARDAVRRHHADTAYVVGGGSVYRQFLPVADELVLTELDDAYEGDTTFPSVDWERWRAVDRDRHESFDIVTYARSSM
ncbi:dihydrofolate reductase [Haloarcula marina]|uniref:dihydrofolate reductase n=1 Tax=Haloarcula marina TaxID=2961574 RepID=UPI0020B63CB3|nr:dihydrofolate reductase [Halomicroarcula marina]